MKNRKVDKNLQRNKQKLKISDYVLEIDGKDITKATIEYEFIKITSVSFLDGKKDEVKYNPAISIEIRGIDNNNNEAWFCFELDMSLEQLNKYTNKPVNITEFVSKSEAFI